MLKMVLTLLFMADGMLRHFLAPRLVDTYVAADGETADAARGCRYDCLRVCR